MLQRLRKSPVLLILSILVSGTLGATAVPHSPLAATVAQDVSFFPPAFSSSSEDLSRDDSAHLRAAARLQARIERRFGMTLSLRDLERDMLTQRELLERGVTVRFVSSLDGAEVATWTGSLAASAHWLSVEVTPSGVESSVSAEAIERDLTENHPSGVALPARASILELYDDDGVLRAKTDGVARTGYEFDATLVASAVTDALRDDAREVDVELRAVDAPISNLTPTDLGELRLLASGHSDFAGSGVGRKANVRKGVGKYVHNVVVPPGENFSMNKVLEGAPLREWELALGIFNGHELRPVPGGGLCQVATTVYRAVLNAGLPVVTRANHSLYVSYYEKYGVGIDATIFPGKQDFVFRNDTGSHLLIQAYTEGDRAIVSIYGSPDGRIASLEGPYFADNAPEDLRVKNERKLSRNEVAWYRTVAKSDGTMEKELILSRYMAIPRSVAQKHLHVAAPEAVPPRIGY